MASLTLARRSSSIRATHRALTRAPRRHEPARSGRVRFSYLLGLLVLLGAVAAGLYFARPDLVEAALHRGSAESWISVKAIPPVLVSAETIALQPMSQDEFLLYRRTQAAFIKSPFVLVAALRDMKGYEAIAAQEDPVTWLQREIRVDFPGDAELMRVSMSAYHQDAAKIVDGVVEAYVNEVVNRERIQKSLNYDVLLQTSDRLRQDIHREQEYYKRLTELVGTIPSDAVGVASEILLRSIDTANEELRNLKSTRMAKSLQLTSARKRESAIENSSVLEHAVERELGKDPELAIRLPRLIELQAQLANAQLSTLDGQVTSDVKRLSQLVKLEEASIEARKAELRQSIVTELQAANLQHDVMSAVELEQELAMIDEAIVREEANRDGFQSRLRKLGSSSPDLLASQRRIEQLEISYKKVASEARAIEVELKAPSRVNLIQKAS